jgi:5'-nucleotidase
MSPAPLTRRASRGALACTVAALVATTALTGLTTSARAAVPLPRETCVPVPGLPCLPDVPGAAPVAETPAAITGTPKVDETLTAVEPTWDNPVTLTSYQWQRDGVDIEDATESTYVVAPADIDAAITVDATGTVLLLASTVSTSEPVTGLIGDAPVPTTPPTISGSTRFGETLTADPGEWADFSELSFDYQWYRSQGKKNVQAIAGADDRGYRLTATDAGRKMAVVVVATRAGHTPTTGVAATGPVDKLASEIDLRVKRASITKKKRAVVEIELSSADSGTPSGKVVIRDGGRKVGTGQASTVTGRATVRLKRLKPGTHPVVATYTGTKAYSRAQSSPVTITVTHK